eukprot:11224683-Lingulodinium_polyedra.AAC.1
MARSPVWLHPRKRLVFLDISNAFGMARRLSILQQMQFLLPAAASSSWHSGAFAALPLRRAPRRPVANTSISSPPMASARAKCDHRSAFAS